ncbi:hypothetical protein [Falsirhodobacter xinxiangensis]|uniref:hypothetical protein n=1 Tax=Falsirhodobacter xinxiangensis TaxID=2530049 RepID=UPI0010AB26D3|nr:hypothetical protein [Rhodobacter xinxiangensis]
MAYLPEVTRHGLFSMQVCVPADFTDDQVSSFAERECPCGTEHGWSIRREGDEALQGYPERMPCNERDGCVHIMLDA